jgi:hypothetical protein
VERDWLKAFFLGARDGHRKRLMRLHSNQLSGVSLTRPMARVD